MTLPALTLPPTAPSRSDPPATFITRADAFVQWQYANLVPELNTLLPEIVLAGSATNYNGTSTTSLLIGTGSKTFTTQTSLAFSIGQFVQIANTGTPANYMYGQVTAYNSGTGSMTVLVSAVGGAGTLTAWTIGLAASSGAYAQLSGATFTGAVRTVASSAGGAGFNIPHGTAPTTPTNGDIWTTSTGGVFARINGVTQSAVMANASNVISTVYSWSGIQTFAATGGEGGEIHFGKPPSGTTLAADVAVDVVGDSLRFWEGGGTQRGATLDLSVASAGVASNIVLHNATQTLTNKTLTSPTINTPTIATPTITSATFDGAPIPTVAGTAPGYFARAKCFGLGRGTNGASTLNHAGNIASVTRTAAGTYAVVFTTNAPDANYVALLNARINGSFLATNVSGARAASGFTFTVGATTTGVATDPTEFDFTVHW